MLSKTECRILFSENIPDYGFDYKDDVYEFLENYYLNNIDQLELCIRTIESSYIMGCLDELKLVREMLVNLSDLSTSKPIMPDDTTPNEHHQAF